MFGWLFVDRPVFLNLFSKDDNLDLSLISSGGEGIDDEDVTFSEPPLDDEDDDLLTRPSSGFSPSPQPLTSTHKTERKSGDEKPAEKKDIGTKQRVLFRLFPQTFRDL